ncbi:MAG: AI-2E family transporter [Clostridium sp.]|uniref:AI-2E family transporter n=2 Tax=Clostridium sp. TaxID=1506 RepID=UPI0032163032
MIRMYIMRKFNWKSDIIYKIFIITISVGLMIFLLWKFPIFKQLIGVIIVSFIISYSIRPFHKFFTQRGINKKLSALIVILVILGFVGVLTAVLVPWVYSESSNFKEVIANVKQYYDSITKDVQYIVESPFIQEVIYNSYEKFKITMTDIATGLISEMISMAENVILLFIVPTLVYFFLSDGENISNGIMKYIPFNNKYAIRRAFAHMDKVMERYIITQFELCGIIGVLTFIALTISGVKYVLILSFINAIFNIIPYFGPIIGAIPIVVIALLTSTKKAVMVMFWLFVIQQLEGDIICPKILGETVDSHPVTILLLLIVGGSVGGIIGMIIVIPVWVMIKIMVGEVEYYLF